MSFQFRVLIAIGCLLGPNIAGCQSTTRNTFDAGFDQRDTHPAARPPSPVHVGDDAERAISGETVALASFHDEHASPLPTPEPAATIVPRMVNEAPEATDESLRDVELDVRNMGELKGTTEQSMDLPLADGDPTLQAFVDLAVDQHPDVARAAADIRRLRGRWLQVGLPPNPTAGYTAAEIGNEDNAGQQGFFVGQNLVRGNKLQLNRSILCREIEQAEQRLAAAQLRVANGVRLAYYELQIAKKRSKLAKKLVSISRAAAESSQALVKAEEVSRVALLQSRLQIQEATILKRKALNDVEAASRSLANSIGSSALDQRELDEIPEIETGLAARFHWEETSARLLREHPMLAEAALGIDRARASLRRAVAEPIPDVNVQLSVQYDFSTDYVVSGVQVGMPIPIWNRNQGDIRAAQAAITFEQRRLEQMELTLQRKLADEFRKLKSAEFELSRYEEHILPTAEEAMMLVGRAYSVGEAGYLEQLAAQRTFFETNLGYLAAQASYWRASVAVDGLLMLDATDG